MSKKFIAISGSLRAGSYNTSLLKATIQLAPEGVEIEQADISQFPLYNQDLEAEFPSVVSEVKQKIEAADGVIFISPEFNRSIPGPLSNAIDWISRPYGQGSFKGKSALVMGASMGPIGTAIMQSHLKYVLLHLGMNVVGQPEFFLGTAQNKFDENGVLTDESTKEHIVKALNVLVLKS